MTTPIADSYRVRSILFPSPDRPTRATPTPAQQHRQFQRSSVTIKPTDDPFASRSDLDLGFGSAAPPTPPLGGEEWRISEEGSNVSGELDNGAPANTARKAKLERRPSFLKGIITARRTKSASSLSTSTISNPILASEPPRLSPLYSSPTLLSFPSQRDSIVSASSYYEDEELGAPPASTARQPSPRFGPEEDFAVPPTTSGKAFEILGGPRITTANQKAVEKLTGVRASVYTEEDRLAGLGLALTTDAPTRYISPDNRISVMSSNSTATTSDVRSRTSSLPDVPRRETTYSSHAPSQLSVHHEDDDETYHPANEDGDAISLGRDSANDRLRRQSSFPPPTVPIPPLPAFTNGYLPKVSVSGIEQHRQRERTISASTSASGTGSLATGVIVNRTVTATVQTRPSAAAVESPRTRKPSIETRASSDATPRPLPPLPPAPSAWAPVSSPYMNNDANESKSWLRRKPSKTRLPTSLPLGGKASQGPEAPTKTIACAYIVAGLPKDPSTWSLSDHADSGVPPAHSANAVQRFWRPEVLGCSVSGESLDAEEMASLEGERVKKGKGSRTRHQSPPPDQSLVILTKEEVARIQSKAMKLAFNRDIEIISSTTQPASSLATFSFTIPNSQSIKASGIAGAAAAEWDSGLMPAASSAPPGETTYHATCLLVWSHADTTRSAAIRTTLKGGAKAKSEAIHRAAKAASAGRKLGARLAKQMASPMGSVVREGREWGRGDTTDGETDGGYVTESEWGDSAATAQPLPQIQATQPLWLPFALVLVSQIPLYNLLSDVLRISWARYHQDFSMHSRHMRLILNSPSPRAGEKVLLPVSVSTEQAETRFVARMPGKVNWDHSVQTMDLNVSVWPLFRALDADSLLTIAEDPGPWLIAVPSQSRFIALADLPPEVAVVDLDSNSVRVTRPHPGALSTGSTREKARTRLSTAIGSASSYYTIPGELMEAFPSGRFRPFSEWDQNRTLLELDAILREAPRPGRIAKLFGTKPLRKRVELDPSARHVQSMIRRHANTFVDRRDLLESRINRLNNKLASLMTESADWQKSLEIFQAFSDKLTKESVDLKTRLEKERREARRLTGQVGLERVRQEKLELSLRATDAAREQALEQLAEVQAVRAALEQQKNILTSEIQAVLSADESSPLYESVYSRLDALSHRSDTSSRPGTSQSMRSGLHYRPASVAFSEEDLTEDQKHAGENPDEEEAHLDQLKAAVHEAFASIQSRLAIVLHNSEQLDSLSNDVTRSSFLSSPLPDLHGGSRPDTPPPSATTSPNLAGDADQRDQAVVSPNHEPHRFKPKPFRLTPPVSPENMDPVPSPRPSVRNSIDSSFSRRASRPVRQHQRSDSVQSSVYYRSDSQDTPTTAKPSGSFPRSVSANSFGVPGDSAYHYDTSSDAESFVSFEDGNSGSPGSVGSYSQDFDDYDEGQSTATHHSASTNQSVSSGRRGSGDVRNESPVEGSVELFTRTASIRRRSGMGMLKALPEEAGRPLSTATVRAT